MKILFLTSRFPYPPIKGDKIRAYYPIQQLARNHHIDLLALDEESPHPDDIEHMKQYCHNVDCITLSHFGYRFKLALGLMALEPSQALCYRDHRMVKLIREYTESNNYDLVHIVCGRLAWYRRLFKDTPVIIDWIDALSLSTKRMYRQEDNVIKKMAFYLEWKKMKRFELGYLPHFNYSFITSQIDRSYLNDSVDEVIPNGVDINIFKPEEGSKTIDLIFTGNMGYYANIKAVHYFMKEIYPFIMDKKPDFSFYIVGINPSKEILNYRMWPNTKVTGYVNSIIPYLNAAKIFIAPMNSGAGIQNKILEAMACAIPVVSTSYGNAGIRAVEDKEIIVRDQPEQFAQEVLKLLHDKNYSEKIGRYGLALVQRKFSWHSKIKRINEIYARI